MRYVLAFLLFVTPALAQGTLTDQYGRTITVSGNTYSTAGLTIVAPNNAAALATFNAMSPNAAAITVQTAIPVFAFFNRFTTAEFNALMANSTAAGIIARLNAYGQQGGGIVVTDPVITGYMAQAVAAGLITSARSAQILNLSQASP